MKIHRIQCKAWSQAGYNSGGALKGFQRHHLVNALLVAAALKFVVQKGVNDLAGKAGAHNAAAQTQGIGVVVAAGVLGAERLRAAAGADALDLVGAHRHAHTRAAAQDGEIAAAIGHSAAGGGGIIGIVTAGGAVGAKVAVGV